MPQSNPAAAGLPSQLMTAIWEGDSETARRLLVREEVDWNARKFGFYSPLLYSICFGHTAITRMLLAEGADPHDVDTRGLTPLHWAARLGDRSSAGALIEAGARLDDCDQFGDAPLHLAVIHGQLDMVKLLCLRGASRNGRELIYAKNFCRTAVAAWLEATDDPAAVAQHQALGAEAAAALHLQDENVAPHEAAHADGEAVSQAPALTMPARRAEKITRRGRPHKHIRTASELITHYA